MVAVPIPRTGEPAQLRPVGSAAPVQQDWTHLIAAGTLMAGGALLVSGRKKSGLAVAIAGTAIALLDEPEMLQSWWHSLPGMLSNAQQFLDKVEEYMGAAAEQGHRIQSAFRR
ncbi:MAG TPA: hypothetical protein VL346_11705 [Acidobacteriaceae bacterium]|nr:hypothetical protein [Acidobacteriaceae bacterium]